MRGWSRHDPRYSRPKGPPTRYCATVRGDVPHPCPLRHPVHGCVCEEDIIQHAAVLEADAHMDRDRAERTAREEMRAKAIQRRATQQKMFG